MLPYCPINKADILCAEDI